MGMKHANGYWTPELIKKVALNYDSISNFKECYASAYRAACRLKIREDVCKHMRPSRRKNQGYWSLEKIKNEASKWGNVKDFSKNANGAYVAAIRLGVIREVCCHMGLRKPRNYWNKERILEEALLFSRRKDFEYASPVAYTSARRLCILDEACEHMAPKRSIISSNSFETKRMLKQQACERMHVRTLATLATIGSKINERDGSKD